MATKHVKEKAVEPIELFSDLIYVYAISRLTLSVERPLDETILGLLFHQVLGCLIIIQAWLYLTNYINRYGQWRWHEYALTTVNMAAAVYAATTFLPGHSYRLSGSFNLSMLVMLLTVLAMYVIQLATGRQEAGAARSSVIILSVDCALYLAAFVVSMAMPGTSSPVITLDAAAVLVAAFLPFLLRGHFDVSIISFPHLGERFEALATIMFGEAVVGMTGFFDPRRLALEPLLVFAVILLLFGCYILQLHYLCDRRRSERALRLMFSHYFIVIAISQITLTFHYLENHAVDSRVIAGLASVALIAFFIAIYADSHYYRPGVRLTRQDGIIAAACVAAGVAIMFAQDSSFSAILAGELIAAAGNFAILLRKQLVAGRAAA